MKQVLKWLGVTFLALWGLNASAAQDVTKLAVLPTIPDLASSADLLAAGLSTRGSVTLLERDQVARVWREQELAAAQRVDWVKLGRLLNADGVLALDRRIEHTNEMLAVRLIAVKPGVVIVEHRFPMPLSKPDEWGQSYAAQIERFLPKLRVKPEDAVPISLLNLRTSLAGGDSALEQELTALLSLRLTREPALFVLERWRLEALQFEKDLTITDPEPFWNGAYVLDGTINRDVVSRETLTIHARLASPRGDPVTFEVSDRRDTPASIVDRLTQEILRSLSKAAISELWRPEKEAEKFHQEAVWAGSWRLFQQMKDASDASWALGRHTRAVAAYRLVSRVALSCSMLGPRNYDFVPPYGFRPPPSQESLSLLLRALEIYRDASRELATDANSLGEAWESLGLNLLCATDKVLDRFRMRSEFRHGQERELAKVRALAREVNSWLLHHLTLAPTGPSRKLDDLPMAPVYWNDYPTLSLYDAWLDAGGLWFERPVDAVKLYRTILEPTIYPIARAKLLRVPLPLASWSAQDRLEIPSVWMGFLGEMVASTNEQMRLDGLRLILIHSQDPGELEVAARRLLDEAWSARRGIFRQELDAPVAQSFSNLVRRVEHWGRPSIERLQAMNKDWSSRFAAAEPGMRYEEWTDLYRLLSNQQIGQLTLVERANLPSPQRIRELIQQIEGSRTDETNLGGATNRLLERLRVLAGSPVGAFALLRTNPVVPKPVFQDQPVTLAVSQRWSLERLDLPRGRDFYGSKPVARNMVWHDNRLWLETRTCQAGVEDVKSRPTLVSLDPQSMRAEMIEAPFDERSIPFTPCHSVLVGHDLFICSEDAMWRRNANGDWSRLPEIAPGWATPCVWGNRIVLDFGRSILEYDPQTTRTRILASARRNPMVGALDQAAGPWGPLAVVNGDILCARVRSLKGGYQVWSFDSTRQDWVLSRTATNCGERVQLHASGVWYRQSGQCGPRMLGGWRPGSSALECYTWEEANGTNRAGQISAYTPPLWIHPDTIHPHDRQAAFDGPDLWIFPTPGVSELVLTTSPRNLLLLDRRFTRALEFQLELIGAAADAEALFDNARVRRMSSQGSASEGGVEYLATPEGLAMLITDGGILLWVPKSDLNAARAESLRQHPQPERFESAMLRRFDIDRNGWLEDTERRVMRRDANWRLEEQAAVEAAVKRATSQHGAEWDALFTAADKDGDGKLTPIELIAAVTNHPVLFAGRLRGVNAALAPAMWPYDQDGDLKFDHAEFHFFLGDPRLVAEVNRSVDWVKRFGLRPDLCDLNDDGLLDDAERAEVDRRIQQRKAGSASKDK